MGLLTEFNQKRRSEFLKMEFRYSTSLKIVRRKEYISFSVYYHDEEIYHSTISMNIITDILFINICEDYLKNELK